TLISNSHPESGGAISQSRGELTLNNCVVRQNSAKYGGGIHNVDGRLILNNCVFTENTAVERGGGIFGDFTNGFWVGSIAIANSTFSANRTTFAGGTGGAMEIVAGFDADVTLTVDSSTFSNNTSP